MKIIPNITTKKQITPIKTPHLQDTRVFFCGINQEDKIELSYKHPYETGLAKLHNVNKDEYFSLTSYEKKALMDKLLHPRTLEVNTDVGFELKLHQFTAEIMKKVFDKQYGEGNYVVIPIGRSLSSIGKALGLKIGEENVKNIPLSEVRAIYSYGDNFYEHIDCIRSFTSLEGFDEFKKYLSYIGLDKKTVNSSGKHYIIMDYASSGQSLHGGYSLLTSNQLLGNKNRNITSASINDVVTCASKGTSLPFVLTTKLNRGAFKRYSYVDKLYSEIENVKQASDHNNLENKVSVKLFGFGLLNQEYSKYAKPFFEDIIIPENISIYPRQNKKIWNGSINQFILDTREDIQEIFKIMETLQILSEKQQLKPKELNEIIKTQKFLDYLVKRIKKEYFNKNPETNYYCRNDYYTAFRPKLLKIIDKLNEKYPYEIVENFTQ